MAAHGAGMAWLWAMRPNAAVIELRLRLWAFEEGRCRKSLQEPKLTNAAALQGTQQLFEPGFLGEVLQI